MLLISALLTSFFVSSVLSCGITTHIEIGHRAARYFEYTDQYGIEYGKLIADHQDAFQAGNPYPDTFYDSLCHKGKFHGISEDSHWAPFLNVTINYIRKTYPQPWDEETQKLVVFMLGFVSHQVADISWHSLGIDQGFLATMGQINFFGSFPAAHDVGDEGGDVVTLFEFDTRFIGEISEWYIPVQDLVAIYQEYYEAHMVNATLIEECSALMFLGRLGEKLAVAKLYPSYASKSPYLIEEFQDYFLGGVDDMAVWTTNIWRASLFMLQNGTESCQIPHSTLFINCPNQVDINKKLSDTKMTALHSKLYLNDLSLEDVNYRRTDRGVYIGASSKLKRKFNLLQKADYIKAQKSMRKSSSSQQPVTTFYVKNDYAKLGWCFLTEDINGDNVTDLIVGAPGYSITNDIQLGRVYIIYGSKAKGLPQGEIDLDLSAAIQLTGLQKNGRFGSALAVLDVNLDGISDLVVSAPSVGSTSLTYYGEVYIFLGSKSNVFGPLPNITIKGQDIENDYYNLGLTLSVGDVNRDGHADLIIGSPFTAAGGHQRGMVNVMYANRKYQGRQILSVIEMDVTLTGDQDYGWFGHRIEMKKIKKGTTLLLVSQPTYRICSVEGCPHSDNDTQSVGRILGYDVRNLGQPVLCLHGGHSFDKLGASIALGDPYNDGSDILALGVDTGKVAGKIFGISSNFNQAGYLRLLNLTNWAPSTVSCNKTSIPEVAVFKGDRSYARFGMSAKLNDVTGDKIDDLIVSAPFRIDDITEELYGGDTGFVYIFKGGEALGKGDVTMQCSFLGRMVEPCLGEKAFRKFTKDERGSHFGKGVGSWKINNATALVVSAVGSNYGSRLSGALYLFDVK
ncbi:phosphatidylinositol-glycan-specific phospholipase D-like [Anneissia japonica]|uniref:phosphatidylinositol-glycan-specific phospholipase D-like n=1 Tax=Anneissia japonica TaxID=1529436 RepID=UPI00142590AB|nr:phosphatidylinositol-glycan-specific phospholipase D-like [Anneissia japonica]